MKNRKNGQGYEYLVRYEKELRVMTTAVEDRHVRKATTELRQKRKRIVRTKCPFSIDASK